MKLSFILLFFIILQSTAGVLSQNLTLDVKNQSLRDVLRMIETQSNYRFFYNDQLSGLNKTINLKAENASVEELLNQLLDNQQFSYTSMENNMIVIAPTELMQQRKVSGTVTDSDGNPLPGVSVFVQGTTIGTVTDPDGNFELTIPADAQVLVFTFVGMSSQEIAVGESTVFNVTMVEEFIGLDEVVVVGYGTQRRVNLTGSISTVDNEEISRVAMPTLTQALMGKASGLFIKNMSGQPGTNKTSFNIRGFGNPLIIVDGAPVSSSEFQQINPNDIENFSILKDAAAASIYGSRAGNGVILVSTKRGFKSAPQISLSSDYAQQFFTHIPDFLDAGDYLRMKNYSEWAVGRSPVYSQELIDLYDEGGDPEYPNNQMWPIVFHKYAPQATHNFNVRGGTDNVRYFLSAGWFDQNGMLKANTMKYDRYSFRSNIDVNLTSKLNLETSLSFISDDYIGPRQEMEGAKGEQGIIQRTYRQRTFFQRYDVYPDKSKVPAYGDGSSEDPYYFTFHEYFGYRKTKTQYTDLNFTLKYDLPLGFQARANYYVSNKAYSYKRRTWEGKQYFWDEETDIYTFRRQSFPYNELEERRDRTNVFNQQYILTWQESFNNHNFSGIAGYEVLSDNYDRIEASRIRYELNLDYLFAGPDLDKSNYGTANEGGRSAFFGRINYDYMGKYLLEFNSRWDASPNFPPDSRWGFFPSLSLGWRLSEEDFMSNISFLDNLKIRASHGNLGYDRAGDFQYLATYSMSGRYIFDNTLDPGLREDAMPNPYITWEKMTTSNIGIDFGLWNHKLDGSLDYFYRKRTDVLGNRILSLPNVVGAVLPQENYREFDNRGWELSLQHRNKIGEISYSLGTNLSWNREKALVVDQSDFSNMEAFRTGNNAGEWTDRYWLYQHDGLFKSQEEIDNYGVIIDGASNRTILPGDVKFVDYNGDGIISGADRVLGGRGTMPRFIYGINMDFSWKGFDFLMLWQGASLFNVNLSRNFYYARIFSGNAAPLNHHYYESYVPENPWLPVNTDARFPRWRDHNQSRFHSNYTNISDIWYLNGAYIRLKNIQLGYNLPKNLTDRVGINNLRIYIGGYNILTLTADMKIVDPEADHSPALGSNQVGIYHPQMGTYNLGIDIKF